ncbi:MAG: ROK family protein [Ignavibacteriales bacterium]|nr:ROK family protein [Ignavibacteriales bacterium]
MELTQVVLGIDVGGTNTVFGIVDEVGNCFYKDQIPTDGHLPANHLFDRLFQNFNKKFEVLKDRMELVGIGVGAPTANYFRGTVENPNNLKWGYVNVVELINEHYALPVAVTNDANAAAVGEMKYGAAKEFNNFIEITLGTGLGSGIIIDGNLIYGQEGFAGEIGHTVIEEQGRHCGCGRKGCLETYASANGIKRTVFELLSRQNNDSCLRDYSYNSLTSKLICESAIKGDKIANEAFEYTGKKLGKALANSVAHLNPEAIILYGGLALAGDLILKPVQYYLEDSLLHLYKDKLKILVSSLMNDEDAAILGSAAIIWYDIQHKKNNYHSYGKIKE